MLNEQISYRPASGWSAVDRTDISQQAQLVLAFGSRDIMKEPKIFTDLKDRYPKAYVLGCSTAGEVYGDQVVDNHLVATAIKFEATQIRAVSTTITDMLHSRQVGEQLASQLDHLELVHVFVLCDGLNVNGSELVHGITAKLPENVSITGGLSADGSAFEETYVMANAPAQQKIVTLIGLYGTKLRIGYSSLGGWETQGDNHTISKSSGNILYELDGKPVLPLYKEYLGDRAKDLPSSGLLFPLCIRQNESDEWVVRTILGVDEDQQALVFAGDMNEGFTAKFMKADFEKLVTGATNAAKITCKSLNSPAPDLAILISCVGRKLVLNDRIGEEITGVKEVYGHSTQLCGFYSYGEISPFTPNAKCELHNQTMTITTLREKK